MYNEKNRKIENLASVEQTALYTVEELAPLLRVSERTLRRYCVDKVFPNAAKIGGKNWVIPGCDVLTLCPFLASQDEIVQSS